MREQFTFYRSFYEAIKSIKEAEDRARIYDAISDYALNEHTQELDGTNAAIFTLIKPTLDAAKRKSDGAKGREKSEDAIKIPSRCAQDTDKIPSRYAQDTDMMPSRYDEVEIEDVRKEKEKERENEKEKEYEKESYIPSVVSPLKGRASRFTPPTAALSRKVCKLEKTCALFCICGKVCYNERKDKKE